MTEPVIWGLTPAIVTGAITALVNVLRAFGVLDITDDQLAAINTAAVTLMLVLATLGTAWARSRVTPVDQPVLKPGTTVNEYTDVYPTSTVTPDAA